MIEVNHAFKYNKNIKIHPKVNVILAIKFINEFIKDWADKKGTGINEGVAFTHTKGEVHETLYVYQTEKSYIVRQG